MSEKPRGKKTEESAPLMDELTELIEKERTLLNLKLIAQKGETETWKQKYDKLIEKVGTGAIDAEATADQQLEAAAEVESLDRGELLSSYQDMQRILIDRASSWILDLKDIRMSVSDFAKLFKEVFGSRSSYAEINTVNLSQCGLTDEFTMPLLAFIRSSRLQALDLSSNDLSETFFLQLLSTLKDRRTTPQYLLLENNPPLSFSAKHFAAVLDTLTDSTWGLTMTLNDFTDVSLTSAPLRNARGGKREANFDYKETTKQPGLAHEFLRTFNTKLDPAGTGPLAATGPGKAGTTSVAAIKKAAASNKTAVLLGRTNGLHRMTVFGLKYAQLSRRTVALLETTLLHTSASLTDLDLSFAYMGYPGAEVMGRVLSAEGCQIIRLALIGNAFGDAGMVTLSKSLQAHRTLTYLDLRSNAISNPGLKALTTPLTGNQILTYLDLRGNDFTDDSLLALRRQLDDAGSSLHINWAKTIPAPVNAVPRMVGAALFEAPHKVKVVGVVGKVTKLFSVDLAVALQQQNYHAHGGPVSLQWRWRPVPLGTYDTTGAILTLPSLQPASADGTAATAVTSEAGGVSKSARARQRKATATAEASDNAAFFQIGSTYSAFWEVRVVQNHQELFRQREPVTPTSAVSRGVLQRNPEWVSSSIILNNLHAKGTVEVFVTCLETSATAVTVDAPPPRTGKTAGTPKKFVAYEGASLSLSEVPARPHYPCGGDALDLSPELNSIAGRKDVLPSSLQALYPDLAGSAIVRRLRWTLSSRGTGQLRWQARLQSEGSTAGEGTTISPATAASKTAASSQEYPPNHHSLGYAWVVLVCPAEGGAVKAAEGVCTANLGNTLDPTAATAHDKLRAWLWQDCEAHLSGLHADDVLYLAVRPISDQPNYPAAVLKKCTVGVRHVQCLAHDAVSAGSTGAKGGDGEDEEDAFGEHKGVHRIGAGLPCDLDFAALLAVHDDANACVPL